MTLCTHADVENRLRRPLTTAEISWLPGMIEEATQLVLAYLGAPAAHYTDNPPAALTIVTSRMVARVISEGELLQPETFGATQAGMTAGPYSQHLTFTAGSRTGAPWLTKVDKTLLDPYRVAGKAYSIDTAPTAHLTQEQAHHILTTTNRGWKPIG